MFVGQVERGVRDREAFQELDYRAVFGSMTKWTTEIDDPRPDARVRLARLLHRDERPAGPGGDRAAEGHAVRAVDRCPAQGRSSRSRPRRGAKTWSDLAQLDREGRAARSSSSAAAAGRRRPAPTCAASPSASTCRSLTSYRRSWLFDALHPCYAGDLGLAPNPKLVPRVKAADLVVLVGGRLGEIPSQGYSLFDIPAPQTTFVHVHPGAEELGRVYRPDLAINASPIRFAAALGRAGAAGGTALARPRPPRPMPTISPGARPRRRSPAASTSARSWCSCASCCRPTPSCATAPAITPPGSIASTGSASSRPTSRRPRPRWATACRPPSR